MKNTDREGGHQKEEMLLCMSVKLWVSLVQFFVKVHNEKMEFSKSAFSKS